MENAMGKKDKEEFKFSDEDESAFEGDLEYGSSPDGYRDDESEYHESEYNESEDDESEDHESEDHDSDDDQRRKDEEDEDGAFDISQIIANIKSMGHEIIDKFPLLKSKKILISVGFVIIVMIFFQFERHSDTKTAVSSVSPQTAESSAAAQLQSTVSSLSKQASTTSNQLSDLQSKSSQLGASLSDIQSDQAQTSKALDDLSTKIDNLSTQVSDINKKNDGKDDGALLKTPEIVYHLRAVDSNRAWLVGSDGSTKSVTVGDKINDNYGDVVSMNPSEGSIFTSNNKVIKFGPNDH